MASESVHQKFSLAGRNALVTGAATGIGRGVAIALADAGASVAVNHWKNTRLAEQVVAIIRTNGSESHAVDADVTDEAAVNRMFEWAEQKLGPIDIVVNCAGVLQEKPFLDTTLADWDFVVDTDLKGIFLCCRAALNHMVPRKRGSIVNIASELGHLGRSQCAPYCAAKAGVMGLTKSLAREFAPAIRVNAIAPGPVNTPMLSVHSMSAETIAKESEIPAARIGEPDEIAATAVFLASDAASFFYGQIVGPNGGAHMG